MDYMTPELIYFILNKRIKYTAMMKFLAGKTKTRPINLVCFLIMESLSMKKLLASDSLVTNKINNSLNNGIYRRFLISN